MFFFLKWNTAGGKKREKQNKRQQKNIMPSTKHREHKTYLMCKTASLRTLYIMKQKLPDR